MLLIELLGNGLTIVGSVIPGDYLSNIEEIDEAEEVFYQ